MMPYSNIAKLHEKKEFLTATQKLYRLSTYFVFALVFLWPINTAEAENNNILQGLPYNSEDSSEVDETEPLLTFWDGKISLGVLLELSYEYTAVSDTGDKNSGKEDDFFVNTMEFDLSILLTDWLEANAIAGIEDIEKAGDDARFFLDEAILLIRCPWVPLYFVGGKRTQPFGVFEDPMISGTITEDLYEIVEVGATVGINPDFYGLDLSLTIYYYSDILAPNSWASSSAFFL